MKQRLFIKFLLGYLFFGIVAYILIMTFIQNITYKTAIDSEAAGLYRESALIASDYASDYYRASISLEDFQSHMEIVADYLSAEIWVMDSNGNVLINSSDSTISHAASNQEFFNIGSFDIADFGDTYYMVGDFYSQFDSDVLISPDVVEKLFPCKNLVRR